MPIQVRETIFVVAAVIVGAAFLVWFFLTPVKHFLWRHNLSHVFYNAVMRVARNGDYYLISNLRLKMGKDDFVKIDHLIGGDKFIYVITDEYYEGAINASPSDSRWVYYKKGGRKSDIPNPLLFNKLAMERLSIQSGISSSFLVGIVLINDDCFVNAFENSEGEVLLVPISKLEKVVGAYEKKDVEPFVKKELWQIVHDLHELNEKESLGSQ
jgi:hypothetical protein